MKHKVYTIHELHSKKLSLEPGDFMLGHKENLHDRLIHLLTQSPWNHAALVVNANGDVVEISEEKGIQAINISKEVEDKFLIVKLELNPRDRTEIINYAETMLKRKIKFGFLSIFSIALNVIFNSPLIFKSDGSMTCSEFVASALEYGGVIWDKDPALITPAYLYQKFRDQKS